MIAQSECTEATGDPAQTLSSRMRIVGVRVSRSNDFAEQSERWIGKLVFFQDRIKGNIFTVMPELAVRNVEDDSLVDLGPVSVVRKKHELCRWIDKIPNQPRTRDAVDFDFFTGYPFHRLGGEFEIISDSGRERFFINNCGRGGVFNCYSCTIKNDDLRFAGAPDFLAGNDFA